MVNRNEGFPELVPTRGTAPNILKGGTVRALNAALRVAEPTGGSARGPVLTKEAHATSQAIEQ